jgi:hypothetical protein
MLNHAFGDTYSYIWDVQIIHIILGWVVFNRDFLLFCFGSLSSFFTDRFLQPGCFFAVN